VTSSREPVGTFCLVLHTHLPWVAHAGAWPVGEEWLHQAVSHSYLPVVRVLDRLAAEGRRDLLTLGITPVLAAQLDDPYCLEQVHTWLGFWQARAQGLAGRRERHLRELATYEHRAASRALADFESRWAYGASAILRGLADTDVVELLGGPATHPFTPLLDERLATFQLGTGLDDAALRLGRRPSGIWAPECGFRPGMEHLYDAAKVRRFVVDGPTLHGDTSRARTVGDTDVVVFGRDLEVTYRVWSPRRGYPGGRHYRDFHTFDHASGFRPARVTSTSTPPEAKAPWVPAAAAAAAEADAEDFVALVRRRLEQLAAERDGRPGLVVAAYDTELFGHWWHEGPAWLERVLRLLPEAGVQVTTLAGAIEAGHVGEPVDLPAGSWGSGKDWRVWDGAHVDDLAAQSSVVAERLLAVVDKQVRAATPRRDDLDQLAREAMLVASSDWAFCVAKDSAAGYARDRAASHAERFHRLADRMESGRADDRLTSELRAVDGPFGHLDARGLARP
jgi:1,4-alpha-glucan branching enzyme